ncbi:MAG: diaminopimelate decarboxylase [Candidatus Izimaplasma sp.]|nr:diaminopimelate decarboxylase [Candidatus Izimaplasma bacterium]
MKEKTLHIGGISVKELAKKFQTPLYVYDVKYIKNQINLYQTYFKSSKFETAVAYASKAFLSKDLITLLNDKGMYLDVVSGGELYMAKTYNFDMSNVLFHGNNKSKEELSFALEQQVGLIVVDNLDELKVLNTLSKSNQTPVKTLLRVNPGIEAHTHEYIVTAKHTSKFGVSIYDDLKLQQLIDIYAANELLSLEGFHSHIGSQIFDISSYIKSIKVMKKFLDKMSNKFNISSPILNIGGGFGIYYTNEDDILDIPKTTTTIIKEVENTLDIKKLMIEPGRSIVGNAGMTLYKAGYTKKTFGGKEYVFVDGGMSDNIRPALYNAKYSADIANNMTGKKAKEYTIAGKLCESGDELIKHIKLPQVKDDDLIVVYTTGAYTYSMASNYNLALKPAVVFVEDETAKLSIRRQTYKDLLQYEV